MQKISILDCTLRDGGYCNQWLFGQQNVKKINKCLVESGIDIIECGFLNEEIEFSPDITKYNKVEDLHDYIPANRDGKTFVAMINYGEYNIDHLEHNRGMLDGIRLAFHKDDLSNALELGRKIQEKGYLLFLQPMVSLSYSDEEFLFLIKKCNGIKPFAFYIVDSFGVMRRNDLIRMFYIVEHNLDAEIAIGFHCHNNMQLAYSNAQSLVDIRAKHSLIIDCCVYGMGRGAGNLNTELFVEYLNDNIGTNYKLKPLLKVIDEILDGFYQQNYWGYSLPNYLSASHNTHPNYAIYLNDKHTLTVKEMNDIFDIMDNDKRLYFDKDYIDRLYLFYLSRGRAKEESLDELIKKIEGKAILLIAPGKSSITKVDTIREFSKGHRLVIVSINHDYLYIGTDYIFISNLRRFTDLNKDKYCKCIVTSNIPTDTVYLKTDYRSLLNPYKAVRDNAGLMAIKFFIRCGAREIFLAGMDGYSHDTYNNFSDSHMAYAVTNALLDEMNTGMSYNLEELSKEADIQFLTNPQFIKINKDSNLIYNKEVTQ